METRDIDGKHVAVGDSVKVLIIRDSVLDRLDADERVRASSMKGLILSVYEVDEWGGAWVRGEWKVAGGRHITHSLSLSSSEMQRVNA